MQNRNVLISGASIAGPVLAHWLARYGFDVTVVEKARTVRPGGQAVDFKGPVHRAVLERTGVLDAVRRAAVDSPDGIVVDAAGRKVATVPGAFGGGEINVPRGDLAGILHRLTAESCTYLFGDSITSLRQDATGVRVEFEHAAPQTFDLVVGADGIHSNVRRLAFGPEQDYVHHLGYAYALAGLALDGADEVAYSEPGRTVLVGGGKAPAFFVWATDSRTTGREDVDVQKSRLVEAFRGGGWRLPELLAQLPGADEFYSDALARVRIDRYAEGRVVLLGDAAYGNTLGGYGTGLALVGAYVLAGELAAADGDHAVAFAPLRGDVPRLRLGLAEGQRRPDPRAEDPVGHPAAEHGLLLHGALCPDPRAPRTSRGEPDARRLRAGPLPAPRRSVEPAPQHPRGGRHDQVGHERRDDQVGQDVGRVRTRPTPAPRPSPAG